METPDTTEQRTSMSAAFAAAGYRQPETNHEKLRRIMAKAITADGPGRGVSGPGMERFKCHCEPPGGCGDGATTSCVQSRG